MYLAQHGIIPPEQWEHFPTLENKQGYTVAVFLERNRIETPQQWRYDSMHRLRHNFTTAMRIAQEGVIPSKYWEHKPEVQNKDKYTVAMYLASKGVIPPKQWQHNPFLQNDQGRVVYDYLVNQNIYGILESEYWNTNNRQNRANFQAIVNQRQQNQDEFDVETQNIQHNNQQPTNMQLLQAIQLLYRQNQYLINLFQKPIINEAFTQYCELYNVSKQFIKNNINWNENEDKTSFGLFLAQKGIFIDNKFDEQLKDKYNKSISDYRQEFDFMNNFNDDNQDFFM